MNRYKVVIVDDDPWTLVDIRSCFPFDAHGFAVAAECGNAESALPAILQHQPELVITDIRMEQSNGLDLIRMCRKKGSAALFVILSGYDSFAYAKEAVELGAFRYMLKPISDDEAQQVVRQASERLNLISHWNKEDANDSAGSDSDPFSRMLDFLEAHNGENVTLNDLSNTFFLNRTYICDLFRKRMGKTFTEYITEIRMRRACCLLKDSALPVDVVAQRVGFEDARYFARVFKSIIGKTPHEYRLVSRTGFSHPDGVHRQVERIEE